MSPLTLQRNLSLKRRRSTATICRLDDMFDLHTSLTKLKKYDWWDRIAHKGGCLILFEEFKSDQTYSKHCCCIVAHFAFSLDGGNCFTAGRGGTREEETEEKEEEG